MSFVKIAGPTVQDQIKETGCDMLTIDVKIALCNLNNEYRNSFNQPNLD